MTLNEFKDILVRNRIVEPAAFSDAERYDIGKTSYRVADAYVEINGLLSSELASARKQIKSTLDYLDEQIRNNPQQ